MTSLGFHERMSGHVALGTADYNEGLRIGRREDSTCAFELDIDIAEIDAFLADPTHLAAARGVVHCGALGGVLPVEEGRFNLFVPVAGAPGHRHMRYHLQLRDPDGRPVTLSGFKDVADGLGLDIWSDTSTLFVRLLAGHVEDDDAALAAAEVLGAGVLEISHAAFVRMLASMRARGGAPWRRARAIARFQLEFAGTLAHVYGGRTRPGDEQTDFPDLLHPAGDPFRGRPPGEWHAVPGHEDLRRRILPLRAGDGLPLTLHHLSGPDGPAGTPVLCLHGSGVRGDIFVGAPGEVSLASALVAAGHDVWIANWRASIDLPPRSYVLDEGAVFDHPAAIAEVLKQTGAASLRVLAHCQGATSFTMTALAGLAPEVTHVVASAVSLHTVVARRTKVKSLLMLPLASLRLWYLSAQWGVRAPTVLSRLFARLARLIRRECEDPVCSVANYLYGTQADVLWVHAQLTDGTHDWVGREFGWVPTRFLRQMGRCTRKGRVVPVAGLPVLPRDLTAVPVPEGQRWTFLAGTRNRLYRSVGQERSHAHWVAGSAADAGHELVLLDGYGHLDPLIGRDAARDAFPAILRGLA